MQCWDDDGGGVFPWSDWGWLLLRTTRVPGESIPVNWALGLVVSWGELGDVLVVSPVSLCSSTCVIFSVGD
jgi:hypothetical protein